MTHGAELQSNPASQPPVTETTVTIKGLGNVSITTHGDFGSSFDPERVVSSMFDGHGRSVPMPQIVQGRVYEIPGQSLIMREQPTFGGDRSALQQQVGIQAREVRTLRGLGLSVAKHASVIVPVANIGNPNKMEHRPAILTITEKLSESGERPALLNPSNPEHVPQVRAITNALQTYYTSDMKRPHLLDITTPGQYTDKGVLLDLDLMTTEPIDIEDSRKVVTDYESCGKQLREMHDKFDLTKEQIDDLQRKHSASPRQRIEINRPSDETSDTVDTELGMLAQLMRSYSEVQTISEKAKTILQIAIDMAQESYDLINGTGEWVGRDKPQVDAACRDLEAAVLGMNNLKDFLDQTIEGMWGSFPKI